jgi:hypothetical protein
MDFDHIKKCKPVPTVNSGTVSETFGQVIPLTNKKDISKSPKLYFQSQKEPDLCHLSAALKLRCCKCDVEWHVGYFGGGKNPPTYMTHCRNGGSNAENKHIFKGSPILNGDFFPLQNIQHAIRHHIYSNEASMLHLNDTNLVPSQVEQWILII